MEKLNDSILVFARVLLGTIFIVAGFGKLGDVQGFAGYMASGGVPAFLAWPVVLFEILGGLAVVAGLLTRASAIALAAFSLLAGVLYHFAPADPMQMNAFLKNLAIAGGFLALFVTGPGRFSLDRLVQPRTVTA